MLKLICFTYSKRFTQIFLY